MLGDSKDERARGVQLAAEALATMESLESLLPATYRFGLEAYKVYFSSYAKLAGSGSADAAGQMVPMAGWNERMRGAYEKIARMAVEGHFYKGDIEFWGEHWKKVEKVLPPLQGKWEELLRTRVGGLLRGKARQDAINAAWRELRHELPEEMKTLMQAVGEVRADKLMAKFMERVALQLDAFRKDKTLGRIRRVVGALKPGAKENGKPVKGRMDAERYRKVVDLVRLMELTRGEKELFERERYTGEGTEKAWADLEPNDTVTVKTYDGEGKEVEIVCSKEEFETYACFELMTASQAEAASRALGEYISTGRQAWDNAQEAARQRIAELCAPAMEKYGETENEKKARREKQQRKVMPLVNKTLNFLGFGLNDAQFFDVCSKVPEIEKWTKDAVYRIASAHTYIEAKERDRQDFMTQAAREASGEKDDKKVREWLDDTRRNRDTGIKLAPQEPDFAAQEAETVRRQFMGLLRRKTHKKNFNPNTFAEALRYLTEEDGLMPEAVAREALDKYGTLGDAKASRLHGKEALMSILTDNEYARFSDLTMTAKKRAEAAREKWQKDREEEEAKRKEEGKPKEVADPFSKSFAQRVIAAFSGQKQPKKKDIFTLCKYPVLLQQLKPWGGNVHINWENMYKLSKKHNLTPEQIARLPQEINNPIAVIEDRDGSLLVVTDIDAPTKKSVQENRDGLRKDIIKRKTIAVLRLGRSSKTGAEIVDLITAYSHDTSAKQVGLLREKRLLYLDKERSGNWTSKEEDSIPPLLKTLLEESGSTIMVKEASPDVKQNNDDETLVLSPAQAAYRVLLWEQADYTESLSMQGYTPAVVQRLREFAGDKVMRMAYALREKMGERTEEIRDVYERVYGMPFPEVENYFRAFFDVAYETRQEGIMSGEGAGYAAGAGTMKILYHRNHRNARIDPTMTMYEAFNAGMKEQDLLLGYGELPSELLRILNYKEGHQTMSDALEKCLGSGALSEMRQHVENMSRLVPEVERYARAATRLISEWSSAGAQMILNWRAGTLVKQLTAFFNGVAGSEYVGVRDYYTSLGKVLLGLGRIKLKDLAERPELKGRFKGWENAENMKAMMSPADVPTAMPKAAVAAGKGMPAQEWLDVWTNVRQAAAIYDAAYRKLRLKVPEATPEELDGLAMREVQHALALKSQPLDWRQRSLASLKKSPFTIGSFFLGGESVNTFANFARLLAKHEYLDAAAVWLSHGFGLQALTALYNFITDDKEQWEKRSLGGYFRNALLGPLGGIPLLSTAYNDWIRKPLRGKVDWLPYVQTTDLIPAADIERLCREWRKANKSGEWEAYTLACDDTLRVVATGTLLAARNSTGKAGLWAKAGAVIAGGVGNIVDFFVRVERAAKERWELWD